MDLAAVAVGAGVALVVTVAAAVVLRRRGRLDVSFRWGDPPDDDDQDGPG